MSSDVAGSWQEAPEVGRAFVVGCIAGTVSCFGVMTVAGVVGGMGLGASLGLATFVAFWGGLGFGGMFGGVAGALRAEAAEHALDRRSLPVEQTAAGAPAAPAQAGPERERQEVAREPVAVGR